MRKSRTVSLTLLTAAALASTGCDNRRREVRNCVDNQNHIVADSQCSSGSTGGGAGGGFHYRYGGASGGRIGDTVVGGSEEPEPGARIESGESVERGGFGAEGGEGGHGGGE